MLALFLAQNKGLGSVVWQTAAVAMELFFLPHNRTKVWDVRPAVPARVFAPSFYEYGDFEIECQTDTAKTSDALNRFWTLRSPCLCGKCRLTWNEQCTGNLKEARRYRHLADLGIETKPLWKAANPPQSNAANPKNFADWSPSGRLTSKSDFHLVRSGQCFRLCLGGSKLAHMLYTDVMAEDFCKNVTFRVTFLVLSRLAAHLNYIPACLSIIYSMKFDMNLKTQIAANATTQSFAFPDLISALKVLVQGELWRLLSPITWVFSAQKPTSKPNILLCDEKKEQSYNRSGLDSCVWNPQPRKVTTPDSFFFTKTRIDSTPLSSTRSLVKSRISFPRPRDHLSWLQPSGIHPHASQRSWSCPARRSSPS